MSTEMLHTFTALPTSLDGDAITYTLGDPSSDPKTTAHSLTILTYLTPSDDTHPCLLNDRVDKGYKCVQDDRLQSTLGKQEGKFNQVTVEFTGSERTPAADRGEDEDDATHPFPYWAFRALEGLGPVDFIHRNADGQAAQYMCRSDVKQATSFAEGISERWGAKETSGASVGGKDFIIGEWVEAAQLDQDWLAAQLITDGWKKTGPFENHCTLVRGSRADAEAVAEAGGSDVETAHEELLAEVRDAVLLELNWNRWAPISDSGYDARNLAEFVNERVSVMWADDFKATTHGQRLQVHESRMPGVLANIRAEVEKRAEEAARSCQPASEPSWN